MTRHSDPDVERRQKELAICADARQNHYTLTQLATEYGEDETYIERVLAEHDIVVAHSPSPRPVLEAANRDHARTEPRAKPAPPVPPPAPLVTQNRRPASNGDAISTPAAAVVRTGSSPVLLALGAANAILEAVKGMQAGDKAHLLDALDSCLHAMQHLQPDEQSAVLRLVRTASGFVDDTT